MNEEFLNSMATVVSEAVTTALRQGLLSNQSIASTSRTRASTSQRQSVPTPTPARRNPNTGRSSLSSDQSLNSDDDFQEQQVMRRSLPSLYASVGPIRRRGPITARRSIRTKSLDVFCLLYESGEIFSIPRGVKRENLVRQHLTGKIKIVSNMTDEQVKSEIKSIFWKTFNLDSLEAFTFRYLSPCAGSKKLHIPNVSPSFKWEGIEVLGITSRSNLYIMASRNLTIENVLDSEDEGDSQLHTSNPAENLPGTSQATILRHSLSDVQPTTDLVQPQWQLTARDRAHNELQLELELPAIQETADQPEQNLRLSAMDLLQEHIEKILVTGEQHVYVRRNQIMCDAKRAFLSKGFSPLKQLKVRSIGEPGIDNGGPRKEFLDSLLTHLHSYQVFEGEPGNFTLVSNMPSLFQDQPYFAGIAVALILCQGRMAVPLFSEALIRHLAGENKFQISDVPCTTHRECLTEVANNPSMQLQPEIENLKDKIGFFCNITSENVDSFINSSCRYLCSIENAAHIAQFAKGLETCGINSLITNNIDSMLELLTGKYHKKPIIDANVVFGMFEITYSEDGTNVAAKEQEAILNLLEFLMNCCCGNGIHEETEGVGKCCIQDFLQFVTGARQLQLFGQEKPKIIFNDQPFPTVHVCSSTLTLPLGLPEAVFSERLFEAIIGSPEFGVV